MTYYKTYYDDFVRGKIQHIEYPDINIKGELEEYFLHENEFELRGVLCAFNKRFYRKRWLP